MNEALSLGIASSHNGAYQSGMAMRRILSMRIDVHIRIYSRIIRIIPHLLHLYEHPKYQPPYPQTSLFFLAFEI